MVLVGGLQIHGHTYDHQFEEGNYFRFKDSGPCVVQEIDRFLDVFGQH